MFSIKKANANSLIGHLRKRGMTLEQIAAALAPDHQGRPVSRVTLSKILSGDRSGVQLVDRLCVLVDGEPLRPERPKLRTVRDQREQAQHASPVTISPQAVAPRLTRSPPAPSPKPSPRRQLLRDYQALQAQGLDETTAKRELQRQRIEQRQQAEQQRQDEQLQAYTLLMMGEARRRLSMGSFYNERDVAPAARELARAYLHQQQRPRLPDAMPKRLTAPAPFRPAPEQSAGFVWMGRLRRPAMALGDGRDAVQEESRNAVQALIASLIRQPIPEPPDVATALAVAPLGVPPRLGTPLSGEAAEETSLD
jgi:hypothetical protein